MQIPDLINGLFEAFGGCMLWLNVRQIIKDKAVKGVHWLSTSFFTLWGYWNIYYYPHLGQWFSFAGGLLIVAGNTVWIILILKYWEKHESKTNSIKRRRTTSYKKC